MCKLLVQLHTVIVRISTLYSKLQILVDLKENVSIASEINAPSMDRKRDILKVWIINSDELVVKL